jgi:hypothetical protein
LRAVDLFGPTPLEVIEGFEHGEARVLDPSLDAAVLAHASLGLLSDPANDAAAYAAENIEGGMVKFRQSGQLL